MRTIIASLSFIFFAATFIVMGAALRLPVPSANQPPPGPEIDIPHEDSAVLERALNRLAEEQAASQATVIDLQDTVIELESRLAEKQAEALDLLAREQDASRGLVAELEETIAGLRQGMDEIEERQNRLSETRKPPLPPRARSVQTGTMVAILGGGLFQSGQDIFSPEMNEAITGILPELASSPSRRIILEGHTDSLPIRANLQEKFPDNQALSLHRAKAIAALLIEKGILPERVSVAGFGASRPLATNRTADGRAENRRVEVRLLSPISNRKAAAGDKDSSGEKAD